MPYLDGPKCFANFVLLCIYILSSVAFLPNWEDFAPAWDRS